MMTPPEKRQVTLEDLLRLKRAERPPAEFWVKFERELRAKQLAAIVDRRPWWRTNPLPSLLRYRLSLGATAIVALSFLSVRQYQALSQVSRNSAVVAVDTTAAQAVAASVTPAGDIASPAPAALAKVETRAELPAVASLIPAEISPEVALAQVSESTVIGASALEEAPQKATWLLARETVENLDLSPVARSIADNLAAAQEAHPELTNRFLGVPSGFEKRALPAVHQAAVDPLAQMRSPGEVHRERLLASAASVSTNTGRTSEKIARRISDERLTEEAISRFGARGDRVLVKF